MRAHARARVEAAVSQNSAGVTATFCRPLPRRPRKSLREEDTEQSFSLDNLKLIPLLKKIGHDYAEQNVKPEHLFPPGNT